MRRLRNYPPFDHVLMFKVLILQSSHNLSFMRFLGLGLDDTVPDANTIWGFREALTRGQDRRPPRDRGLGFSAATASRDRRKGRHPWPLRHLPDGRGRGATTDVSGNPVADRPVAGTARASMRARGSDATKDDSKGAPRCRQSCAFQRLGAVN